MTGPFPLGPLNPRSGSREAPILDDPGTQDEFLAAIERYRTTHGRPYPTWSEVLAIAEALGYEENRLSTGGRIKMDHR